MTLALFFDLSCSLVETWEIFQNRMTFACAFPFFGARRHRILPIAKWFLDWPRIESGYQGEEHFIGHQPRTKKATLWLIKAVLEECGKTLLFGASYPTTKANGDFSWLVSITETFSVRWDGDSSILDPSTSLEKAGQRSEAPHRMTDSGASVVPFEISTVATECSIGCLILLLLTIEAKNCHS